MPELYWGGGCDGNRGYEVAWWTNTLLGNHLMAYQFYIPAKKNETEALPLFSPQISCRIVSEP